ncbi:MAG: DUF4374 domain-containing protein [Bacteroidales bacterium]
MKRNFKNFVAIATMGLVAVGCTNDNPLEPENPFVEPSGEGKFIIVTEVDDMAYILAEDTLSEGSTTIEGNGEEFPTAGVWHYIGDTRLWSIKDIGGDDPAQVYAYELKASTGEVAEVADFYTTKYNSWGTMGSNFAYMAYLSSSDGADTAVGQVYGDDVTYTAVTLAYTVADAGTGNAYFNTVTAEGFLLQDEENPSPETVSFPGFTEAGGKVYVAIATQGVSKYATLQDNFTSAMETLIKNEGYQGTPSEYVANGSGICYAIDKNTEAGTSGYSTSFSFPNGVPFPLTPDKVRIAVYDASTYSIDKAPEAFISSDLMGQAYGRYVGNPYNTLVANDDYVYVFSPGATRKFDDFYAENINDNKEEYTTQYAVNSTTATDWVTETTPIRKAVSDAKGGVMRIKAGATSFDSSFGEGGFMNIEEILSGHTFTRVWHIAGDYFLLRVMSQGTAEDGYLYGFHKNKPVDTDFAIFNAANGTVSTITGLPAYSEIRDDNSAIGEPCSYSGVVYIPISKETGSAVYVVDINSEASTYAAKQGISITADNILGLGFLYEQ